MSSHKRRINQDVRTQRNRPRNHPIGAEPRALGWRPVAMIEPTTGMPFTRWFPPLKSTPPVDGEIVGDKTIAK